MEMGGDRMFIKRSKPYLFASLVGTAFASFLWGATPAGALTIAPDENSVYLQASDVGASFNVNWSQSIGNGLPDLMANSVWTILGFQNDRLTLGISLTNATLDTATFHSAITSFGAGMTPNGAGQFAPGGAEAAFKNISSGNGPKQTFPGGFKGIDLCVSSSGCSGGSFNGGLHAGATDIMTVILLAAFGADPSGTLAFFPIKFQTSSGSYEIGGQVSTVPLPATLPLLILAVAGFGFLRKRRITAASL